MAKAAKKLSQPKPPINEGFIDAIDKLHLQRTCSSAPTSPLTGQV